MEMVADQDCIELYTLLVLCALVFDKAVDTD